jgi:glutamate-1-semialdehyde 2,1-aminomutase
MTLNKFSKSEEAAEQFKKYVTSGSNSPGRLFNDVNTPSLVIKEAHGSKIIDLDGNEYIDFVMGLGPNILGHCPDVVQRAIKDQLGKGLIYGMNCELELELSKRIIEACPHLDQIRFTCSGTEAVMTAIRVARAHTNRSDILKFKGGYHGHSDALLSHADKSSIRHNPSSVVDGIHDAVRDSTLVSAYNDIDMAEGIIHSNHERMAAVIIEPVATNMGLILPNIAFLKKLRSLCTEYGIVLIFDEVVSGFRLCYGTVSDHLGIQPDLSTFGKIIGGGLPVGAYGGRAELMKQVSHKGGVFQGGTFAGNPLTMAAGLATLDAVSSDGFYENVSNHAREFTRIIKDGFLQNGIPFSIQQYGPLASFIFTDKVKSLSSFSDVEQQNTQLFSQFHLEMAHHGVLFPPSIEEPIFFCAAHSQEEIEFAANTSIKVLTDLLQKENVE